MDQITPSTYSVIVVFLHNNAEINAACSAECPCFKNKLSTTYGKEEREEEIWEAIQELKETLNKELIC